MCFLLKILPAWVHDGSVKMWLEPSVGNSSELAHWAKTRCSEEMVAGDRVKA